jgi:tetratricopeptide (TPR) repeat protein
MPAKCGSGGLNSAFEPTLHEPFGRPAVASDFLPLPEKRVPRDNLPKIAASRARRRVDFVKWLAARSSVPNREMIHSRTRSVQMRLCLGVLLWSSVAMVLAATPDPKQQLQEAQRLFVAKNRPLPAEALIQEAMSALQRQQDWHWLGHAYREYGDLLKSDAVSRLEKVYRRDGFRDSRITFDHRLEKAAEFYRLALVEYRKAEATEQQSSQYDALTNLYFNMGLSSHELGEDAAACDYFSKMVDAAVKNRDLHAAGAPSEESVRAMARSAQKSARCDQTPP